jgi:acetolactate synthase-1/2/3 large subunit
VARAASRFRATSTCGASCSGSTSACPDDAILTNGAGNYTVWVHRLYRYRGFRTELAPYSGAMGYGVPSAVAAKAVPTPTCIVGPSNGDGLLSHETGQELANPPFSTGWPSGVRRHRQQAM